MNATDANSRDLDGKVALVTGSSTGLGLEIAKELGRRGAKVALNYAHNQTRADTAIAEFTQSGGEGAMFRADVTDKKAIEKLVGEIKSQLWSCRYSDPQRDVRSTGHADRRLHVGAV